MLDNSAVVSEDVGNNRLSGLVADIAGTGSDDVVDFEAMDGTGLMLQNEVC